jgi:hypothetical protein
MNNFPNKLASKYKIGHVLMGNDGELYTVVLTKNNIKRWVNAFKFDAAAAARKVFGEEYLYPDYTDLVSWESGSGMVLHADNCDQEGNPNYCGWRNYSGVLYLNDDFAGGETIFPNQGPIIIKPKKGKLVLYPAGLEYSHVVTTVVGTRYVMPIWFTKDKNYIEV